MRILNHIQNKVTNLTKKQLKLRYHAINSYGYERTMLLGINR